MNLARENEGAGHECPGYGGSRFKVVSHGGPRFKIVSHGGTRFNVSEHDSPGHRSAEHEGPFDTFVTAISSHHSCHIGNDDV